MIISGQNSNFEPANHAKPTIEEEKNTLALHETIRDFSRQIQEKDNEINVLVSFIRKHNHPSLNDSQGEIVKEVISKDQKNVPSISDSTYNEGLNSKVVSCYESSDGAKHLNIDGKTVTRLLTMDAFLNQEEAFKVFQRSNPRNQAIQDNKDLLKDKYQQAKGISEHVNKARENINRLKSQIQKGRIERAMQGIHGGGTKDEVLMQDPQEDQLISQIEAEKKKYKEGFNRLRDLKREIEHLHHLLEQIHTKLQEDFQRWIAVMSKVESTSTNQEDPLSRHPTSELQRSGFISDRSCQQQMGPKILHKRQETLACEDNNNRGCRWGDENSLVQVGQDKCIAAASQCNGKGQNTALCTTKHDTDANLKPSLALPERESTIPFTGNVKADAEIAAFYKARDKILRLRSEHCG